MMPLTSGAARILLICVLTAAQPAEGAEAVTLQESDSEPITAQNVRSRARAAQRAFERTRHRHLPSLGRTRRDAERCHEIVGRYCVWHDPDEPWRPLPDPPEVEEARARLLVELEELARSAPRDRWIQGQRVRYLVETGRTAEATELASSCLEVNPTWCAALLGFARHAAGDDPASERAFERAMAALPDQERCRWTALDDLLGRDGKDYRALECVERRRWEDEFWRLADPLYLVPGNSRRAEHFSRHVMDALQEDAASGYDARWGRDLRELLIRYGWPAGWTRDRRRPFGLRTEDHITAHDPPDARRFEPRPGWVGRPDRATRGDWRLKPDRPRGLYAPRHAVFLDSLEHQLARFPRGDSLVLVAAYDVSRDTISGCKSLDHGLFVTDADGSGRAEVRGRSTGTWGVLSTGVAAETPTVKGMKGLSGDSAPAGWHWVSLEVLCAADRWAARSRYGVGLAARSTDGLSLSDLLVLGDPGDGEPPAKLAELLPLVLGTLRARSGERLALYWELYDSTRAGREVDVTVTLTRTDKGFFRKAAEWVGLAKSGDEAVGLQWRERSDGSATLSRTLALNLPVLPEGAYRLSLRISTDGAQLEASRPLRIEEAG